MTRREFAGAGVAALAPAAGWPLRGWYDAIVAGFLRNARATSPSYAVCDLPGGTKLKSCVARSGKTYVGVARMLPALAAAGKFDILRAVYRHAFDPAHPDYWEEPPPDRPNQRQVEAALAAWVLWRLGDRFLASLTPAERMNIQRWLASCTRVVERKHNHAWFSAINQAARLALARRWKEFSGDEQWMLEDLAVLDGMGSPGDGWYRDSLTLPIFDYYNFWTFASHFLEWREIIGRRDPRVAAPFEERLRLFLAKAPFFFGGNGSHVLMGRSLIYRWAVLTPLIQAYEQGLWPHSAGLLKRIVRLNLEFHRRIGSYDERLGKLRETYSAEGSPDLTEFYIDNGHPYWCMQANLFPDRLWTAAEEPLPVERGDFTVRFEGPRMLLIGTRQSVQVRWVQAQAAYHHLRYRDKYIKWSYSSHFPFCVWKDEERCPADQALVFRDPATGLMAARTRVFDGRLTPDGVGIDWGSELAGRSIRVKTRIRLDGEREWREHEVSGADGLELMEGSAARSVAGQRVECRVLDGFESAAEEPVAGNILYAQAKAHTLRLRRAGGRVLLRSLHEATME